VVEDVRKLVELHLRFHGYGDGWTDSAVRRYVRDAGPLLDRLNQLTRADCTTRNVARARKLEQLQDELEERIARLAEEENLSALRPPIDGAQVMKHLGIPPGPLVGEALSYLFELRMERGPIPEELRSGMGRHLFGCDICQDVCPWSRDAPVSAERAFDPVEFAPPLAKMAALSREEFKALFGKTPVSRARYSGFLRNVAVAMGNSGLEIYRGPLEGLANGNDPLVSEHARWALGRLDGRT
jgi:hypothetical protein